ncbi:hypothetical protein B0T20DRAFT_476913 [Sordaria brevicollis]|uniref:Uncharacterized protein n=1 Tax=Sordaria brevicollis TaxID=83679 RepID=A0AAE0PJ03_SORBR|nr:hypothetical protein B0T20DRAFT_476913 [Sordaria brevicollis]
MSQNGPNQGPQGPPTQAPAPVPAPAHRDLRYRSAYWATVLGPSDEDLVTKRNPQALQTQTQTQGSAPPPRPQPRSAVQQPSGPPPDLPSKCLCHRCGTNQVS